MCYGKCPTYVGSDKWRSNLFAVKIGSFFMADPKVAARAREQSIYVYIFPLNTLPSNQTTHFYSHQHCRKLGAGANKSEQIVAGGGGAIGGELGWIFLGLENIALLAGGGLIGMVSVER